ncbi:hypothetical protein [Candidatus Erwinia haradaeae]|uniref:Ubiquinone biosynthesis protein UbiJ, partial n=1 Tax=Candidatus Erwinia haradaeae TaxID=1922217 RepID=A0A451DAN0_9GAMM|nr:hypothetical protein [Candidatus Erwinia haradaeae]VFP83347.1 Ubiquinone biosynthesis protein UbiJ [Candidatus Erwinia haradaeae]
MNIKDWLSISMGDILTQKIWQHVHCHYDLVNRNIKNKKKYLSDAFTEEWNLMPSSNELACFIREVDVLIHTLNVLDHRIQSLEKK